MFNKILIANRGAIACRIIRTLKTMNIRSVAVYAEADIDSLHVQMADEAYSLGQGVAAETYLDQQKLFDIIARSGAEAVHPGYGFLSENSQFVDRCEQRGIVFIGPTSASMQSFSLKHEARALAEKYSVPLVPGTGLLSDLDGALRAADDMGYPVMLKSTAGGGGIGMQVCHSRQLLAQAFDAVVRLSVNNFSNGGVFLEKYIACARHIEVQVFGDGAGVAVALGERDCSLQRRNQKVIEETPAPNLSDTIRQAMHDTAIRLLSSVKYASAGTVEYIYDAVSHQFYFLEVNTRLQVEHGVTEEVYGVDLVQWMVEQAFAPIADLRRRSDRLSASGHAIQARIYAENPGRGFRPAAGLLSHVSWPQKTRINDASIRIDTWIQAGIEVSPLFDPMLAKVIVHGKNRAESIAALKVCLGQCELYGIETNTRYAQALLDESIFTGGEMVTSFLDSWPYSANTVEVLSAGTLTTIQDLKGRQGYWDIGVPPSGPFDCYSFRLGSRLLGNDDSCAGLEITLAGPTLKFDKPCQVVVVGAQLPVLLDDQPQLMWSVISVDSGQTLKLGKLNAAGMRAYLVVKGGIECPQYLGSRSTFTLGQFGGHSGRALRTGDVLHYHETTDFLEAAAVNLALRPRIDQQWQIRVIYGPHGAPDYFTPEDIDTFFAATWEVHYNSSRTGIRLIGPKPQWARASGGEAGMHPSNIHDNAYAFGSIDFTGDMPVILGPDGPSLGGFVCPGVVINADLWKLGQLRAGDKLRFLPVALDAATRADAAVLAGEPTITLPPVPVESCVIKTLRLDDGTGVVLRPAGDRFLLIEFGEQVLDLALRLRVAALQEYLRKLLASDALLSAAIQELTAGIRSLQIHFNPHVFTLEQLTQLVENACYLMASEQDAKVPSRIVHLPLSWDDQACRLAVEKYMQSVRADAPWCPDNIEFIRRINGLDSVDDVRDILFSADYVVMGLGDVYLGAPVATPVDPRHRLVTTKYNPARTWTAENSVGIGGAYLCVYGMEGPGGYQFVGRTLQMWNRYHRTAEFDQPWLLRPFDRIRFYPVTTEELSEIRRDFPKGNYPLKIEPGHFSLSEYQAYLADNAESISVHTQRREQAFDAELQRWHADGQLTFDSSPVADEQQADTELPENTVAVETAVAGSVWQLKVEEGQQVTAGEALLVLESMKMEIELASDVAGIVRKIFKKPGSQVAAGQVLLHIEEVE